MNSKSLQGWISQPAVALSAGQTALSWSHVPMAQTQVWWALHSCVQSHTNKVLLIPEAFWIKMGWYVVQANRMLQSLADLILLSALPSQAWAC